MESIEIKVVGILKRYSFEKKVWNKYQPELEIINDLNINSARIVDIVLDVEEEFDIEIDDDNLEKIVTIKNLTDIIEQKTEL
ncbi:MAG: phosphopantetheine-binding protein [Bacteroidota bacterium]